MQPNSITIPMSSRLAAQGAKHAAAARARKEAEGGSSGTYTHAHMDHQRTLRKLHSPPPFPQCHQWDATRRRKAVLVPMQFS